MIEIPGGPSITEEKENIIPYIEDKTLPSYWYTQTQNEGCLFIYELENEKYAVNIELNEVYGRLIKNGEEYDLESLTKSHIMVLEKNNILYNDWGISSTEYDLCNDILLYYRTKILISIGTKIFGLQSTTLTTKTLVCYIYKKNCISLQVDNPINFELFRIYFDIFSSKNKENWLVSKHLIKYATMTSRYKNKEDGERKRVLVSKDERYIINRNTNKVIGVEVIIDKDFSYIEDLKKQEVPFFIELGLL